MLGSGTPCRSGGHGRGNFARILPRTCMVAACHQDEPGVSGTAAGPQGRGKGCRAMGEVCPTCNSGQALGQVVGQAQCWGRSKGRSTLGLS